MKTKTFKLPRIGFVGAGNMAEAIINGMLTRKLCRHQNLLAFEVNTVRKKFMSRTYKLAFANTLGDLAKKSDVLLLCVKPQQMREVLENLKPHIGKHLIITIAAGIRTDFYTHILGKSTRVIRVMPNTPAMIGMGAAGIFAARTAKPVDRKIAATLFGATGIVTEVKNESLIDAVTALSGSGPAFVYQFAAALVAGGTKVGLNTATARALALQTLLGAANMLIQSGEDPATLTAKVTSKGGTTFAGLEVLSGKGFDDIVQSCLARAATRAKELSDEFGK